MNRTEAEIEDAKLSSSRLGDKSRTAASILMSPLQVGNRNLGVISAQSYTMNAYGDEHLSLLTAIAQQVVVAIENAAPGVKSIEAVLDPAEVPYRYFVATGEGRHTFTTTYNDHLRAVARARRAR